MALSDLAKQSKSHQRNEDERDRQFARRVAFQQFLRNFTPLLAAGVRLGGAARDVMASDHFQEDVKMARRIAARVYGAVNGQDPAKVSLHDARLIRSEVVDLVAQHRERGIVVDEDKVVATVVEAASLADPELDRDTMSWSGMSPRGSASLTASRSAMEVWMITDIYDFRLGQPEALRRCMRAITEMADEAVAKILGPAATNEDKRALAQSALRDMGRLFCARYERIARETIETVLKMPDEARDAFFKNEKPFETMIDGFVQEARDYIEAAEQVVTTLSSSDRAGGEPSYGSVRG